MTEQVLKVARHQNYLTLTVNRPDKRNALNAEILDAMDKMFGQIEEDKELRAVVVRGEGKHFCAGIDLAEFHRVESGQSPASLENVFRRLEQLPTVTIAAIQGAALAAGLELALHCDIRIAAEDARCGMPVGRVGLPMPYDFTRKLVETIGAANAALVLYTAESFEARRVYEMGMVAEVVPAAALDEAAAALAAKIAGNAPLSLRMMKMTLRRCMSRTFDTWHEDLLEMARKVRQSRDAREGVVAVLEKRKPVWRGE